MPSRPVSAARPLTAQLAFEQMMREKVAPALRQLGFTGSYRSFRYSRDYRSGVIWATKSRHSNQQQVDFRLEVAGGPGVIMDLKALMPNRTPGFGWLVRADRPTGPVADAVVSAVRRYGLPTILAMLEDAPYPAGGWPRQFPHQEEDMPDGHGADPSAWFVQPAGTHADAWFGALADGDMRARHGAVMLIGEDAITDPRAVPALLDRLEHDPDHAIRSRIAWRLLTPLARAHDPKVRAALEAAATQDHNAEVRWAARYALRLDIDG